MLRFLEKRQKSSDKQVLLENPTHQNTDIGAECDRDSEGEHRSRKISGLIRPMESADSTTAQDINRGGGSRVTDQDRGVEDQRLPAPNTSTPTSGGEGDNASECGRL